MVCTKQAQNLQVPLYRSWTSQRAISFISIWHVRTRIKSIDGQRHPAAFSIKDKQQVSAKTGLGSREIAWRCLCNLSSFSWVSTRVPP